MVRRIRLGVIVPSSNTVLEPLTQAIISSISDPNLDITVHFSRFRVTKIDVSADANSQFLTENLVAVAELLADAEVDVIGWSGTSAGWLGFDTDERLCKAIHTVTGVPATTSTLALIDLLKAVKVDRLGLVTPYAKRVNDMIRKNYGSIGYQIPPERERYLGLTKNSEFGNVTSAQVDQMVSDVVKNDASVVSIYCTNLRGAGQVADWEQTHAIMVLDSVATTVWGMLRAVGVKASCVQGWGSLFMVE